MKYFKKIQGERIYLSPMSLEDAPKYAEWFNDRSNSDGLHYTCNLVGVENEREFIEDTYKKGKYNFAIVDSSTDELIGNCGLSHIDHIDRTAIIGIFIGDEKNRNKGFGTEALKLLISYGFDILNLHNISLGVFSFNERAIACYKKIGFKEYGRRHEAYFLDGKYHDIISMEILEQDYRKNK